MEDRTPPYFPDEILDAIGGKSAIFQDVLNVGLPLNEVEAFSDWARAEGMNPVTVSDLRELRSHEVYGRLAGLVLDAAAVRLIHEL